jgi:hypothetical protein
VVSFRLLIANRQLKIVHCSRATNSVSQITLAARHGELKRISLAPFVAVLYAYCAGGPFRFEAMVSTSGPGMALICDLRLVAGINFDADSIGGLAAARHSARPEAGVCGSGRQARSGGSGASTWRSVRLGLVHQRPFRLALGSRLPEFGTLGLPCGNQWTSLGSSGHRTSRYRSAVVARPTRFGARE